MNHPWTRKKDTKDGRKQHQYLDSWLIYALSVPNLSKVDGNGSSPTPKKKQAWNKDEGESVEVRTVIPFRRETGRKAPQWSV